MENEYRVLFVSHSSDLNGAPRSMINLISVLRKYGIMCYVVIPQNGEIEKELKKNGIKYYIIKYLNCFYKIGKKNNLIKKTGIEMVNIKAAIKIVKLVNKLKINIVHSNSFAVDVGAMAAYWSMTPHIWHFREFMEEDFGFTHNFKGKDLFLAKKSYGIIAVSNAVKEKYEKQYGIKKICTVYNGLPIDDYRIDRNKLFNNNLIEILISGNISKSKGQQEAIHAIYKLSQIGYDNIHLNIVGKGEKEYLTYLKEIVKRYNIKNLVSFLGFQRDMKSIRKNMDIEIVCSKKEAFGRVTIEAMLADLLVIGSNAGGTKELIYDGYNGILYERGNSTDLANKIKNVVDKRKEYVKLVRNAKQIALQKYRIDHTAFKVMKIYKSIL